MVVARGRARSSRSSSSSASSSMTASRALVPRTWLRPQFKILLKYDNPVRFALQSAVAPAVRAPLAPSPPSPLRVLAVPGGGGRAPRAAMRRAACGRTPTRRTHAHLGGCSASGTLPPKPEKPDVPLSPEVNLSCASLLISTQIGLFGSAFDLKMLGVPTANFLVYTQYYNKSSWDVYAGVQAAMNFSVSDWQGWQLRRRRMGGARCCSARVQDCQGGARLLLTVCAICWQRPPRAVLGRHAAGGRRRPAPVPGGRAAACHTRHAQRECLLFSVCVCTRPCASPRPQPQAGARLVMVVCATLCRSTPTRTAAACASSSSRTPR